MTLRDHSGNVLMCGHPGCTNVAVKRTGADDHPTCEAHLPSALKPMHGDPNYNSRLAALCERTGEPCFTLRAQDEHAAETLRFWARQVREHGGDRTLADEADKIATEMNCWPTHKEPDR